MTTSATDYDRIEFTVYGKPEPQGSKRLGRHGTRFVVLDDNDRTLKPWRRLVATHARVAARTHTAAPFDGPVCLIVTFTMPRPPSAPRRRVWPTVKPDLSKLVRAVEDSLTEGGVWVDDARVVLTTACKRYVGDPLALDRPGVTIGVHPL